MSNTPKYVACYICERPYVEVLSIAQNGRGDWTVRHRQIRNGVRTNITESLVHKDKKGCLYFHAGKVTIDLHNLRKSIIKEY